MQTTTLPINFSMGVDTKTDPWSLAPGKFLSLENSVFTTGGLLQKRNGYGALPSVAATYLTTLNTNLIAVGSTINAYSPSLNEWISKGSLQPCSLSVLPSIRNNQNQIQVDSVTAGGLVLTVYIESQIGGTLNNSFNTHLSIQDAVTGQNIAPPSNGFPVISAGTITGSSRVTVVGNLFVIISQVSVSGVNQLQYFTIPVNNPVIGNSTNTSTVHLVYTDSYAATTQNPGWDLVVTSDTLVVAYNTFLASNAIRIVQLTEAELLAGSTATHITSFSNSLWYAAILTACVDASSGVIYVTFWNNSTTNGFTLAVTLTPTGFTTVFTPVQSITTTVVANLASAAQSNSSLMFYEVTNAYSYDAAIPTNFINSASISSSGSVGQHGVLIRSVGLASKGFIVSGVVYILTAYQSPFQDTFFLINGSTSTAANPKIVAKLAYENGGGYLSEGLPLVTVSGSTAQISYLFKDDVEALNTVNTTQATSTGGIYSQTGINLVTLTLGTELVDTAEIARGLHISGGYLGFFDGYFPVEHNFFLFPDSVEVIWTENSVKTPTGTFLIGSTTITVSSATGIFPGMSITDTSNAAYIPNGTQVVSVVGTTVTISKATTHAASGDNLSIQGNMQSVPVGGTVGLGAYFYQVTYEWTDNNGLPYRSAPSIAVAVTTTGAVSTGIVTLNIPMLRLTEKINNPVKIVIYRWSEFSQAYNQVTSITQPILNDTTADSVTFVDTLPDSNLTTGTQAGIAGVIGNNLIYTTGGVVPDTNAPSTNIMTLFDTRLWIVDAEDPNLLWVSKQVIEGTPVEMSQFFTIYVAPNTGTVASTGPITALFPMDDKLIIFKNDSIYYINGVGPNNLGTTAVGSSLGNYSQPIFITAVVGCTNQDSIVLTADGLMFQTDKGIWLLSRNLATNYIGAPVEAFNTSTVTSANVIPQTNFVLFTLNNGPMLMYDFYYGQWGTFNGVSGLSSTIYNGLHTVLTNSGTILKETPGVYLDNAAPVLMSFTTSWINLASLQGYERFYEFYLLGKYLSPHFLNLQIAYNYNPALAQQVTITPNPLLYKEQWRVHTKQQLCESFQLTMNEQFNTTAGAGLTLSGLSCVIGIKKATRPISGGNSVGLS